VPVGNPRKLLQSLLTQTWVLIRSRKTVKEENPKPARFPATTKQ
jgi:hypothetical protein